MVKMKLSKTKREIRLIKKSAEISNSCLPLIEDLLKKEEVTEREIARAIRRNIYGQGASLAFKTIVTCGKRAARIHSKPEATNKIISGLGYVDFGASYKGYKTDVTVPFIKDKISKRERKITQTVLKAYELAVNSIESGLPCWKVYEKVNRFLRKRGFKMTHSLGHGVGLKIHELPAITMPRKKLTRKKRLIWKKLEKIRFREGMVFTIEPGIYVKGLSGCRLENTILLTRGMPMPLTKAKLLLIKL